MNIKKKHIHGGNVYDHAGCMDFSANCNPLGLPEGVKNAIISHLDQLSEYPRVGYLPLKKALAEYEHVDPSYIICGNGAAELIFTCVRAIGPQKAVLLAPTFAEYGQALEGIGCQIDYLYLKEEEDFAPGEKLFDLLREDVDLLFLCNPNNPTGQLLDAAYIKKVLDHCRDNEIRLILDECFLDFVKDREGSSMKTWLKEYPDLFILRAFTKRYAMPGIRLGYGYSSDTELLNKMEFITQPWNISGVAQIAGIQALKEEDYVIKGRNMVFEEQAYLMNELKRLGIKAWQPAANYIFFKAGEGLAGACMERGILIRDCSNYEGLMEGHYRIAVRTHRENMALIQVLEEVLFPGEAG